MTGEILAHYRILEKIGAGGMGEVYRARDQQLQREIALKLLPASSFADATARLRLLREARAAAALNHPHICTVHEVGEADSQAYIAMELVHGDSLSNRLEAGPLPPEQVVRYGILLADALAHAHERGVIHRDLKAANVMITSDGRPKILDFGLAKRLIEDDRSDVTTKSQLTKEGAIVGTLAYMSPEQLRGQRVDERSDIWALGVVLYEMAASRRPYRGETGFALSSAILHEAPLPLPPKVPAGLKGVIDRCLEKEPGRRYQKAGEVRAALEAIQSGTAAPAGRHKKGTVAALMVLLGLGLAGGATWLAIGPLTPPRATASPERPRIAVLPFDNLSGAAEEFFTDGITRDVNTQLAKIGRFVVVAHDSAERASRADSSYVDAARRLRADYIVDGSVGRAGDRVRIHVSLVDPKTEAQLWTEEYDREITLSNILGTRTDVALQVARALNVRLSPQERTDLAAQTAGNLEAYREYQFGRFMLAKRTVTGLQAAVAHFERAVALDPNYAVAHAGLADAYVLLPFFSRDVPSAVALPRAEAAARRALTLDPSLGEAHAALGLVREFSFDWEAAEAHFRRAIELRPQYATAHHWYADLLARRRRPEEAFAEIQKALDLDPLSPIINQDVGFVLSLAGKRDAAIRQYQRTVELDPGFATTWGVLGNALMHAGRFEESANALSRWAELTGRDAAAMRRLVAAAAAHAKTGVPQPVPAGIDLETFPPYSVARWYMALGHNERALAVLERAYEEKSFATLLGMGSPPFDSLRSEKRFVALLEKVGLPAR